MAGSGEAHAGDEDVLCLGLVECLPLVVAVWHAHGPRQLSAMQHMQALVLVSGDAQSGKTYKKTTKHLWDLLQAHTLTPCLCLLHCSAVGCPSD